MVIPPVELVTPSQSGVATTRRGEAVPSAHGHERSHYSRYPGLRRQPEPRRRVRDLPQQTPAESSFVAWVSTKSRSGDREAGDRVDGLPDQRGIPRLNTLERTHPCSRTGTHRRTRDPPGRNGRSGARRCARHRSRHPRARVKRRTPRRRWSHSELSCRAPSARAERLDAAREISRRPRYIGRLAPDARRRRGHLLQGRVPGAARCHLRFRPARRRCSGPSEPDGVTGE